MLKYFLLPILVYSFQLRECKTDIDESNWRIVKSIAVETGIKHLILYDKFFKTSYGNLLVAKKFSKIKIYISFYNISNLYLSLRDLYYIPPFAETSNYTKKAIPYPPKTGVVLHANHYIKNVYELFSVSAIFFHGNLSLKTLAFWNFRKSWNTQFLNITG